MQGNPFPRLFDLSGKHALVIGASSGLGAYCAKVLSMAGASVTLGARRAGELNAIAEDLRSAGGSAEVLSLDVTDRAAVVAAVASMRELHIVINSAGVTKTKPALEQTEEDWDRILDTNLKGAWLVASEAARLMRTAGTSGSIVNIASILGIRQGGQVTPYAVSKAGVVQLTKQLALEFARFNIRVNALAPGYFATELNERFVSTEAGAALIKRIPQRRLGGLRDLDGPLLLLASDASQYMTGAVIAVDGGHLVSQL